MIAKKAVRSSIITCGDARAEGRGPSHDGEFLTLFYVPGESQWLLEDNGGVAVTDDAPYPDGEYPDEWGEIIEEVLLDIAGDRGSEATGCGADASGLMMEMGWLEDDGETHEIRSEFGQILWDTTCPGWFLRIYTPTSDGHMQDVDYALYADDADDEAGAISEARAVCPLMSLRIANAHNASEVMREVVESKLATENLPAIMSEAAEKSIANDLCMFCGQASEALVGAEDWDGNEGRACPDCAEVRA